MKQYTTTITRRGQVTLPAEIRRLLGAKPKDKVTFTVDGDTVCIRQVAFTLESAYGSVKPSERPEDFEKIILAAKEDQAEKVARKLRPVR